MGRLAFLNPKSLLSSKTLWAAALAFLSKKVSGELGIEIPHDIEFYSLLVTMIALRFVTNQPLKKPFSK